MVDVDPKTVQRRMIRDIQRTSLENMSGAESVYRNLQGRPWFDPVRRLSRKTNTATWNGKHKGMLKCIAANGIWTLERLRAAGYATDGLCPCCRVPQTMYHLLWKCQSVAILAQDPLCPRESLGLRSKGYLSSAHQRACSPTYFTASSSLSSSLSLRARPVLSPAGVALSRPLVHPGVSSVRLHRG